MGESKRKQRSEKFEQMSECEDARLSDAACESAWESACFRCQSAWTPSPEVAASEQTLREN